MDWFAYTVAFIAGWSVKTAFDQAILKIGIRILASKAGKSRVLQTLADGIEKLESPK